MSTAVAEKLSTFEVTALNHVIDRFAEQMLKSDWDQLLTTVTDDFELMPPDQPAVTGKTKLHKWLTEYPAIRKFDMKMVHAEGHSELATGRGIFSITVQPKGETQRTVKGKWMSSYRKSPEGTWLCASQIWNHDSPAKS
jgi:ketosteroid isomerase-like protein